MHGTLGGGRLDQCSGMTSGGERDRKGRTAYNERVRRVALLLGAVAVVFGAAVLVRNDRSAPWPFKGVTPAELASQGVTLAPRSPPSTLATTASSAAAV